MHFPPPAPAYGLEVHLRWYLEYGMSVSDGLMFSPITVGTLELDHRLVVPPHSGGGGSLLGTDEQLDRMCAYWVARVEGGMQWVGGGPMFVRNPVVPGFEPSGVGASADGLFRHPLFVQRMSAYMTQLPTRRFRNPPDRCAAQRGACRRVAAVLAGGTMPVIG